MIKIKPRVLLSSILNPEILIRTLFVFSTFLLTIILALRIYLSWKFAYDIDHVSGAWAALASDFSHGTFYRPLYSEGLGYGGTRYFPLHFVLHGMLIRFGHVIAMGHLMDFAAFLLLLLGVYAFLRRFQVPRMFAGILAMLVPASNASQFAAVTIRSDALPLMLDIWGLVVCLAPKFGWLEAIWASLLFTLAFAAKQTSVYACIAVCLTFFLAGRRRDAIRVICASAIGFSAVLAAMYVMGGGVFTMMKSLALEGASLISLFRAPVALLGWIRDPGTVVFFLLAGASLLVLPRRQWFELPSILFVLASVTVGIVLSTPGTTTNHLIDVHVAAICLFGTWLFREDDERVLHFGLASLAMAACIAVFGNARDLHHEETQPRVNKYADAMSILQGIHKPILAEDALVPILMGQRPYVIDAMSVGRVSRRQPLFAVPLQEKLDQQAFGAVVIGVDPHSADGEDWFNNWSFGPWFIPMLEKNYELRGSSQNLFFYFPRKR